MNTVADRWRSRLLGAWSALVHPTARRADCRSPTSVINSSSLKLSLTTRQRKLLATGLSSTISTLTGIWPIPRSCSVGS